MQNVTQRMLDVQVKFCVPGDFSEGYCPEISQVIPVLQICWCFSNSGMC